MLYIIEQVKKYTLLQIGGNTALSNIFNFMGFIYIGDITLSSVEIVLLLDLCHNRWSALLLRDMKYQDLVSCP
jgi:hypothetical protein